MKVEPRSAWGAAPPSWNPGRVRPALGIFLHYNGPPVSSAVLSGDYKSVAAFLRSIQGYHMRNNGWPDIAYSFCVDSTGRIWELRGWDVAGAHTMDWNWKSHAIFLPLGGDQAPTPQQIEGCKRVISEANVRYGKQFVKGHQEAPNSTSCPGGPTMKLIRAGAFIPGSSAPTPPAAPKPNPAPQVPLPNGVDPKVNEPTMMKIEDKIWMFYANTPWRVHIKTPADVEAFKFMGVKQQDLGRDAGRFFLRYSQEVKCG
jgi:hypothetical protein